MNAFADARVPRERPRSFVYERLFRWLSAERADRVLVLLGFVLLLPSLDTGLAADDFLHSIMLDRPSPIPGFERAPLDIFRFCDPRYFKPLLDQGVFSWWFDASTRLAFLRPITALTHVIDHALYPLNGVLMHLHSALWSLLLLCGVRALYRELISDRLTVNVALALYALDDARGWLVSWVAARNAAIATALSVWTLVAHHASRSGRQPNGRVLGPLLFVLALLAGEGSLAVLGYVAAYALLIERGALRTRLFSLWPYAGIVVVWAGLYRGFGFGAHGSGLYMDPGASPIAFLKPLMQNGPLLLGSQLGGMWSDMTLVLFAAPAVRLPVYGATFAWIGWVLWLARPQLIAAPLARYALLGTLFAVPLASGTPATDRLLTWIALGACILLAQVIAPVLADPSSVRGLRKLGTGVLVAAYLLGAVLLPSRARGNLAARDMLDRAELAVPRDPGVRDKTLVWLNPPLYPFAAYLPIERAGQGLPWPAVQHILASAATPLLVERPDAYSLRLRQRDGFLLEPTARLLWSEARPFRVGERITQSDMIVTVLQVTADGRPLQIETRFAHPLEDPRYLWLQWGETHAAPFTPPPIGGQLELPAADYVRTVLGVPLPFEARL